MSIFSLLEERRQLIEILKKISEQGLHFAKPATFWSYIDQARQLLAKIEEANKPIIKVKKIKTGREHSGKFEIAPSVENGADHGNTGIVLIKNKQYRLVWRKGSTYPSGIGIRRYAPAELEILTLGKTMSTSITNHFNSGKSKRLSKSLILEHKELINEYFGNGAAELASNLEKTIVIE